MMNEIPVFIKNYLQLEDSITLEQIKILNDIFSKINTYELNSTNVLLNGFIKDGLKMTPKQKRENEVLNEKIKIQLIR